MLQQRSTKKSLLLSKRLHSLLEILKIHEARPLDCGWEQWINFLSSWEQWCFLTSKWKRAFWFYPTNWCEGLRKAVIFGSMGSSTTRKSSNEHDFFVTVTFLSKIGEGRIWDLLVTSSFLWPSDAPYPLWPRKDPWHYWCIMCNNDLMCFDNRTDLPRPGIRVLTPWVLANRTSWPV